MIKVTLYSRNGCHLCETAIDDLKLLQKQIKFQLIIIDIDQDDKLVEDFGIMIPVVEIAGQLVQYGHIDSEVVYQFIKNTLLV